MDTCRNHAAIPMISWGPEAGNPVIPFWNLQSVVNGSQDAYLIKWEQDSAKWGHTYFIRLMWEFTGSWTYDKPSKTGIYPWGEGNSPQLYVQAWQHVVDTIRAYGGTQISWVWCTGVVGDSVPMLQSVYPGDRYVDWVGIDIYASCGQTFQQAAEPELGNVHRAVPNKPVMILETGYGRPADAGYNTNCCGSLLTHILPIDYSYVKAIVIWEMPPGLTVVGSKSFQQGIASSYYAANDFVSITSSSILPLGENQNSTKAFTSPIGSVGDGVHSSPALLPFPESFSNVTTVTVS